MPSQKPKISMRWSSVLPGIALAVVVVVGLALILRSVPGPIPTGQVAVSLIETPAATPSAEILPANESNVIGLPPVEVSNQWTSTPTWTPYPTWTPRPTPTRRPGPTATPFPTRPPTLSAAGSIFYTTQSGLHLWRIPIGTVGEKLEEPTMIPLPVDFSFFNVSPSPDGNYLFLQRPVMPEGSPYIYELNSGTYAHSFRKIPTYLAYSTVGIQTVVTFCFGAARTNSYL